MDSNKNSKELLNRYEKLLDSYIKKFNISIDYDNKKIFYDDFMLSFVFGKLDDSFTLPALKKIGNNARKGLNDLVHKYCSLCFYQGDYRNWSESIDGVTSNDLEFIFIKVLDQFNFLYELASLGGEKVLQELQRLGNKDIDIQSSVVNHLRNSFEGADEVLKYTLLEMAKENGNFISFSDDEKRILLENPKGTLFIKEKGKISPVSIDYLKYELLSREYENNNNILLFQEIVQDISYEYCIKNDDLKKE